MHAKCESAIDIDHLPREGAFVVQLDTRAGIEGGCFRGRVEHIASGVARVFHSFDEMLAFLETMVTASR